MPSSHTEGFRRMAFSSQASSSAKLTGFLQYATPQPGGPGLIDIRSIAGYDQYVRCNPFAAAFDQQFDKLESGHARHAVINNQGMPAWRGLAAHMALVDLTK